MLENKYILLSIKIIITFMLLYLIIININIYDVFKIIRNVDYMYILISMLILFLQLIIANFRWYLVLKYLSTPVSISTLYSYLWVGNFFNQALPSSVSGDALRVFYLHKNSNTSINRSTLSVVLDRVTGVTGLVLLIVLSIPFLYTITGFSNVFISIISFIVLLILAIVALASMDLFFKIFPHWKIINIAHRFSKQARMLFLSKYIGLGLVLISMVVHFLSIVSVFFLAKSMSIQVEFINILLIIPIAILLMTIPVSIAGWGIREGVIVGGLGYVGMGIENSLALSIMFGLLVLVFSLPGMFIWFAIRKR